MPLIDGADWWPDKFNITARISDPSVRFEFFVAHKVSRCVDPRDSSKEIFCMKFSYSFDFLHKILVQYPEKTRLDFMERLNEVHSILKVDDKIAAASIDHLMIFLQQVVSIKSQKIPAICAIKDIGNYLTPESQLNFDWTQFVSNEFLNHSKPASGDDEILIEDWEIFAKSMELVENTAPRIMGDVMFLGFLYGFQHM